MARTSTSSDVSATYGALINVIGTSPIPLTSDSVWKLPSCLPYAFLFTDIGIVPRYVLSSFSTFSARSIIPAHVARTGIPSFICSFIVSNMSNSFKSLPCTVLSPPGRTSLSYPFLRSSLFLNSTHSAPSSFKTFSCSINAPCNARTPTFIIICPFQP